MSYNPSRDKPRHAPPQNADGMKRRDLLLSATSLVAASALTTAGLATTAQAQQPAAPAQPSGRRPNILVIFGDDIGQSNVSAYTIGLMGYRTPNIDRIAREGMIFTDYYAEQSCTAGRSSFITGQCTFRTGLTQGRRAGGAGRAAGGRRDDRRAAQAARLRHRPVRQEPPRRPERVPADRPRLRRVLRQPLPPQRRGGAGAAQLSARPEVQGDVRPARRAALQGHATRTTRPSSRDGAASASRRSRTPARSPRSGWRRSTTRRRTRPSTTSSGRPRPASRSSAGSTARGCTCGRTCAAEHRSPPGLTARTEYADGMVEHDGHVGKLLKALDDLGIADDTIVLYTTDNGPHMNTWPDGAMTPFRSEKNTNWEGAFRVPCMIRWPGSIKAGVDLERDRQRAGLVSDAARRGRRSRRQGEAAQGARGRRQDVQGPPRRLQPVAVPDRTRADKSARRDFFYFNDDGDLVALRYENWKIVFMEQRAPGTLAGLGRAVHPAPAAQAVRPARRSLRAGRRHLQHLLRLVPRPRLPRCTAPRPGRRSSSRRSRNSRPASGPPASPSTRRWRS